MQEQVMLKNVSEDLIEMYLDKCIEEADMCDCARCRADVKAYALNRFPSHYVVTNMGDMMVRTQILSNQSQVDIITAIMRGIRIVKDNPRHP